MVAVWCCGRCPRAPVIPATCWLRRSGRRGHGSRDFGFWILDCGLGAGVEGEAGGEFVESGEHGGFGFRDGGVQSVEAAHVSAWAAAYGSQIADKDVRQRHAFVVGAHSQNLHFAGVKAFTQFFNFNGFAGVAGGFRALGGGC